MTHRVAITGIGLTSPAGQNFSEFMTNLFEYRSAITRSEALEKENSLHTRVAAVIHDFDEKQIPRQMRRSMSRVALLAADATQKAITSAGLPDDLITHDRTGIAYGSTMGGTSALQSYFVSYLKNHSFEGMLSSTFLQIMSHTCAANLATLFKVPGRVIASCTACAASSQAIGFGYEAIKFGLADRMLCGGAEEFHVAVAGVFDIMRATSTVFNDTPHLTPRPFSKDRDGIVVGEGSGTLVLENWDQAVARGATIWGEVVGFYTNADGRHVTNPSVDGMAKAMKGALDSAGIGAESIGYINAHGSGTTVGDIAESKAIFQVFGDRTPTSSLKGHFGHLMGACGVVESIACLGMLREQRAIATLHLDEVDPECAPINFLKGPSKPLTKDYILKNSFAFGGINTSLVFKKGMS